MSKYTTQLRYICETLAGYTESKGLSDVDTIISAARPLLFNFSYPITDTAYKPVLENKIIKHYYMREIGLETVGLFRFYLNEKMNLIMPYYDSLYRSAALEFNPFHDVDYTITHEGEKSEETDKTTTGSGAESGTNTGTVTDSGTGDSWQYNNDTPQGGLSGLTSNNYLSEAIHHTATDGNTNTRNLVDSRQRSSTGRDQGTLESTDSYINRIAGKMGTVSYSDLLLSYRKTLLNIDALVISELSDLFMNIY